MSRDAAPSHGAVPHDVCGDAMRERQESLGALIGMDGRQVEGDLERFRDLVEAREVPTGAWRGEIDSGEVVEDDRTVTS